jgi:NADPH:quinone reductase-like Zn-dependent oxidoreductase
MAKIVRLHAFGGPEVLRLDDVEINAPGPGEVRMRVGAIGLNRVEAIFRAGHFGPVNFPAKIGYEAAGIVEAVGADVTQWKPGDRVATLYGLSMEQYGTYGEEIVYPAEMLVPVPGAQSLIDAAASWMQYGTAYALVDAAQIGEGDAVVVTAASSSVGIAAVQIARNHSAVPIAVTRTRSKAEALHAHGAAHVIVSDEEDVPARILEITNGRGARIAFDAVAGQSLAGLLAAVAPKGIVIVYGMLAGASVDLMLPQLMMANLTLRGFSADLLVREPQSRARLVDYIRSGLERGALKPVIDRCFDLTDIAEAHRHLESSVQVGKIVVTTAYADR